MAAKKKKTLATHTTGAPGTGRGKVKSMTESVLTTKDKADMKRRREKNVVDKKKELRDRLDGVRIIHNIEKHGGELVSLSEDVKKAKNIKADPHRVNTTISKANARAHILAKVIDTQFRLLAKKLPDLRSVEITDANGDNIFAAFHNALEKNQEPK